MSDQPPISRNVPGGSAAAHEPTVTGVEIKTSSGICDAALVHPSGDGHWPGVVLFADAFGYCMGGPMSMRAAAAMPNRVGAGASYHGGGLVTDQPDSPHLLVSRIKARYYFGVAANDDAADPEAKTKLREAFDGAELSAKIEVYEGCLHGWCVKDMPLSPDGKPIYNEAQAERAWNELVALFKQSLV